MARKTNRPKRPNLTIIRGNGSMRGARGAERSTLRSIEGLPSRVYFPRASSTPVGGSLIVLRRYADWLVARRARRVVVLGHANLWSWSEGARALALARSRAVRDLLVFLGAGRAQIRRATVAKLHPVDDWSTSGERQSRRFVEIIAVPDERAPSTLPVPKRARKARLRRAVAR